MSRNVPDKHNLQKMVLYGCYMSSSDWNDVWNVSLPRLAKVEPRRFFSIQKLESVAETFNWLHLTRLQVKNCCASKGYGTDVDRRGRSSASCSQNIGKSGMQYFCCGIKAQSKTITRFKQSLLFKMKFG